MADCERQVTTYDVLYAYLCEFYELVKLGQRKPTSLRNYCGYSGIFPPGYRDKPLRYGTRNFAGILGTPIVELRPKVIRAWMLDLARDIHENRAIGRWKEPGNGTSTANRCLSLLDCAIKKAIADEDVPVGCIPTAHVEYFKETPRSRFLELAEIQKIQDAILTVERRRVAEATAGWRPFVFGQTQTLLLISLTGMRMLEAMELREESIDFNTPAIKLTRSKTGYREIPLSDEAIALLQRQLRRAVDGWVFPSRFGGPISSIYEVWATVLDVAGIDTTGVVIHTLRHSIATWLQRRGIDPTDIQNILGHTSLQTTLDIYCRPLATDSSLAAIQMYSTAVTEGRELYQKAVAGRRNNNVITSRFSHVRRRAA